MAMRQSAVSRRPGVGIELRGLEVAGTESRGMVAPRAARSRSHTSRLSSAYHGESTAVSIQKKGPHARSRGEGTREFVVAGVLSLSLSLRWRALKLTGSIDTRRYRFGPTPLSPEEAVLSMVDILLSWKTQFL